MRDFPQIRNGRIFDLDPPTLVLRPHQKSVANLAEMITDHPIVVLNGICIASPEVRLEPLSILPEFALPARPSRYSRP